MFASGKVQPTLGSWHDAHACLPRGVDNCLSKKKFLPSSTSAFTLGSKSCADAGGAPQLRTNAPAATAAPQSKIRRAFICVSPRRFHVRTTTPRRPAKKILPMTPLEGATFLPTFTGRHCQKARLLLAELGPWLIGALPHTPLSDDERAPSGETTNLAGVRQMILHGFTVHQDWRANTAATGARSAQ